MLYRGLKRIIYWLIKLLKKKPSIHPTVKSAIRTRKNSAAMQLQRVLTVMTCFQGFLQVHQSTLAYLEEFEKTSKIYFLIENNNYAIRIRKNSRFVTLVLITVLTLLFY